MAPSREQLLWMYETMVTARYYEQTMVDAYLEGKKPRFDMSKGPIPGEMHLATGQEPCAVGVCAHLQADDAVFATHRPHHIAIAKGVDLQRMTAEIFGKKTGLSGGRGGHMHLFDSTVRFACSGIVGQGLGTAVGSALAAQMTGSKSIAVSFIGEGAANQGAFHESLNLAAVWQLPVIFVIEDNAWGISVAKSASTAIARNSDRASAYGIPGVYVADNDPFAVFAAAGVAVARARAGEGPSLIEIETYRLAGHFMGDAEQYRPAAEVSELQAKDALPRFREQLLSTYAIGESELVEAETTAYARVDEAFDYARQSDLPSPNEAYQTVFADSP